MVSKQVVTMANCIVGVSVLAMPFCFKQCGVVLATILLLLSGVMTRTVCYFLLKASTITRRRTYELLAYHTYGPAGKLVVEISIIGFLVGTLIAFLVVMGDLGPEILSDVFSVENNSSLRCIIMTALSLFVALPLGLLRNLDSLTGVSTLTMLFYVFLVCKIFSEGMGPLWSGSFLTRIDYWRPAGVLQCIPIFSMALSCQTQIFGIYDSLPDPSLQKMNEVVKKAINVCTVFYISVGFLGYIAFCTQDFGGNIIVSFGPTWSTQLIKLCFVLSIAFSFPLVIFPCRASLHSLIFKNRVHLHHHVHDMTTNHIPESRLKVLTVGIIIFTLIVGLLIPNIELVLGLVGSTTGSVICIIFPAAMFIRVTSKNTTERLLAQFLVCMGILIMILTTYVTLYAVEKAQQQQPIIVSESEGEGKNVISESVKILFENKDSLNGGDLNLNVKEIDKSISKGPEGIKVVDKVDQKAEVKFANSVVKPPGALGSGNASMNIGRKAVYEKLKETKREKVNLTSLKHSEGKEGGERDKEKPLFAASNKEEKGDHEVLPKEIQHEEKQVIPNPMESPEENQNQQNKNLDKNPDSAVYAKAESSNYKKVESQNEIEKHDKFKDTEDLKQKHKDEGVPPVDHRRNIEESIIKNIEAIDSAIRNKVENVSPGALRSSSSRPGRIEQEKVNNEFVKEKEKDAVETHKKEPGLESVPVKAADLEAVKANLDSEKKLDAENVLLQLKEHEKEQKKLLQEQKEILAKLKQHQAEDELKENQQNQQNQQPNQQFNQQGNNQQGLNQQNNQQPAQQLDQQLNNQQPNQQVNQQFNNQQNLNQQSNQQPVKQFNEQLNNQQSQQINNQPNNQQNQQLNNQQNQQLNNQPNPQLNNQPNPQFNNQPNQQQYLPLNQQEIIKNSDRENNVISNNLNQIQTDTKSGSNINNRNQINNNDLTLNNEIKEKVKQEIRKVDKVNKISYQNDNEKHTDNANSVIKAKIPSENQIEKESHSVDLKKENKPEDNNIARFISSNMNSKKEANVNAVVSKNVPEIPPKAKAKEPEIVKVKKEEPPVPVKVDRDI